MNKNFWRIPVSFALACIMLAVCYKYMIKPPERALLLANNINVHLVSLAFCLLTFIISGFEMRYVYSKTTGTGLSWYDTLTLPVAMNFWGFVIPFQGSFFYMTAYLASKYRFKAPDIIYVYVYLFLLSLCISGLVGLAFIGTHGVQNIVFLVICILLFINPFLIYFAAKLLGERSFKSVLVNKIVYQIKYIINNVSLLYNQLGLLVVMVFFSLASTFAYAGWSYSLANMWGMSIGFFPFLILAFLLRVLMIVKLTPGNLGTTQFFAGFIFLLIGAKVTDVVSITVFQSISAIIMAFTLGVFISFLNFKFMPLSRFKEIFSVGK